RGVVPKVWVVAGLLAEQVGNREQLPARAGVGREQLLSPIVVARTVEDDVIGGRERSRIGRAALVLVGIRIRVVDDAGHRDVRAAQLGRETTPEVLARNHLQRRTRSGTGGGRAARRQRDR